MTSFSWTLRRVKEHAVSRTFECPHRLANASYVSMRSEVMALTGL